MRPNDPNKTSIDPRRLAREQGPEAIAHTLRATGYVIRNKTLAGLWLALDRAWPLLAGGPPGTGKTSLCESLAEGCNVPMYEVTGHPGQEARDVIGNWNRRAQDRAEDAALAAGQSQEEAALQRWQEEFFETGEVLDAYREAARAHICGDPPPVLLVDEVEKLPVPIQHTLFQPLARGFAAVPKLKGLIGVTDPKHAPIVILTTNNLKLLDEPLKDRCILTWIKPPTPLEEISIFRARVPHASQYLIAATAKMLSRIREGMDEITRKPGIRNAVLLLDAMADHGVERITRHSLELYIGCLSRDETDDANLYHALPTLERAANKTDGVIDEAVAREFARVELQLCEEEEAA
ncbi:MAG: MoxR family ATPase [Acidobacteria bacterium]|nr:MoxR family ATPase [Acidobacteriota bacterium]